MRNDDPLAPPEGEQDEPRSARSSGEPTPAPPADEPSDEGDTQDSNAVEESEASPTGRDRTDSHVLHKGEFTAPSVGPHTVIEKRPPEERLDFDKISDKDAMGKDKRRQVVGGRYGPTRQRVFVTFAAFFAVMGALITGLYFLAKELDEPPAENPDVAPWSAPDAEQAPPRPLQ